jgi:hypothetical protein
MKLAVPPLSATGVPGTPSTVNVTVPVGVKFGQVTVAVKVTGWPPEEGLALEVSTVEAAEAVESFVTKAS